MTKQNHQHESGSFSKHSELGRSGWTITLPSSFAQYIFLFPPCRADAVGGKVRIVASSAALLLQWPAQAVVLQLSLGRHVALAMCYVETQGAQPRLLSFLKDFTLKVRLYDPHECFVRVSPLKTEQTFSPKLKRRYLFSQWREVKSSEQFQLSALGWDEPYLRNAASFQLLEGSLDN